MKRLNKVDLPAFGGPKMDTTNKPSEAPSWGPDLPVEKKEHGKEDCRVWQGKYRLSVFQISHVARREE
jgi:hypothetical protein